MIERRRKTAWQIGVIGDFLAKHAPPRRLMLNDADFNVLVRGGEIERDGVTIALAGVTFFQMYDAVQGARDDHLEPQEADRA